MNWVRCLRATTVAVHLGLVGVTAGPWPAGESVDVVAQGSGVSPWRKGFDDRGRPVLVARRSELVGSELGGFAASAVRWGLPAWYLFGLVVALASGRRRMLVAASAIGLALTGLAIGHYLGWPWLLPAGLPLGKGLFWLGLTIAPLVIVLSEPGLREEVLRRR